MFDTGNMSPQGGCYDALSTLIQLAFLFSEKNSPKLLVFAWSSGQCFQAFLEPGLIKTPFAVPHPSGGVAFPPTLPFPSN